MKPEPTFKMNLPVELLEESLLVLHKRYNECIADRRDVEADAVLVHVRMVNDEIERVCIKERDYEVVVDSYAVRKDVGHTRQLDG